MKKLLLKLFLLSTFYFLLGSAATAQTKSIGITTPVTISGYSVRVMQSGLTNVKLVKTDFTDSCSGVEIGTTGFYKFDFSTRPSSYPGNYKLYINYIEKQEYGIVQVGDFVDTYRSQSISGTKTFATAPVYAGSSFGSTSLINLSKAQSTIADSLNALRTAIASNYVTIATTQSITGAKTFEEQTTVRQKIITDYADPDLETSPEALVTKAYVDAQISTVGVTPYQESSNNVRVIINGTNETGKVYKTYLTAANYLNPTSTKPGIMNLLQGSTTTGLHYITASGTTKDYLTFRGAGIKPTGVVFDENVTLTKHAVFENMSIYYGTNAISGARSYNSFKFENCVIYAYNNTTFTNCEFYNVVFYYASSKAPTFTGCVLSNSSCNQYISDGGSNKFLNFIAGFNTGYSMPSDPSLSVE